MKVKDEQQGMINLMIKEFEINGVCFNKEKWHSSKNVMRECCLAILPEVHEGKTNSFGALFVETLTELDHIETISISETLIAMARKLSDGREWFLLFEKDLFYGLARFKTPINSEIELIRNFPFSGGIILQRDSNEITKIFMGDYITIHHHRRWMSKPSLKEATWKVSQCIVNIDKKILNQLLEFAFHLLSPMRDAGGILVWYFNQEPPPDLNSASLKLSILNPSHSRMFCQLLSQTDGATFFDSKGNFCRTGVHLKYSDKSREVVSEVKGTRHSSSIRFSYDNPNALVIVISEDGPVTVFWNGADVADLQIYPAYKKARLIQKELSIHHHNVSSHSFQKRCNHCEKNSIIEQVNVPELDSDKSVFCPTCKKLIESSRSFSLEIRPYFILEKMDAL